ncbi:MAG: MBL fold metallo-hydrolase [Lachnospiraceae bacterium]|nr:MBL fold metallo-hydrolase [Lachnospiraceae bacterium]
MNHIRIYQGNQIGGCVTVITVVHNGETRRIMIDYGSSLPGSGVEKDFDYPWEDEPVDAVFFTHYHGDHVGRIAEIPRGIPLYMGATARQAMINIEDALSKSRKSSEEERELHRQKLELLQDDETVNVFNYNGSFYDPIDDIPGFHIEPFSVDHSAYDAYMFLIELEDDTRPDGKYRVLHTGDFRGHGRRGHVMLPLIWKAVRRKGKRNVDALVIEGTMMSRMTEKVLTEEQMQREAEEYLTKNKYAFLICSSTNVDSLASFYEAAQWAGGYPHGRYMYVYSNYFLKQLELYTHTAGSYATIYRFLKTDLLDNMDKQHKSARMTEPMTQRQLMERNGFLAVIKPEDFCEKYIDMFMEAYNSGRINQKPVLIYSMWEEYINPKNDKVQKDKWIAFIEKQKAKGIEVKRLHTSGHATASMIEEVINAVAPTDKIYPMHTERADAFPELNIGSLRDKIVPQNDESYVRITYKHE